MRPDDTMAICQALVTVATQPSPVEGSHAGCKSCGAWTIPRWKRIVF